MRQLNLFGALLVLGLVAGEAFRRYLSLPRITGYAVAGVLLGPEVSGLRSRDTLFELRPRRSTGGRTPRFSRPRAASRGIYLVNSHNRFEACLFGYAGEMVDPYGGPKKKMQEDILDTIAIIAAHALSLECGELLDELAALARAGDSDADWLRARAKARGSLADTVRDACTRWSE